MNLKKLIILVLFLISSVSLIGCDDSDLIKIGILQYLEHDALSDARRGFIDGLAEAGYVDGENIKITVYNPQSDAPTMEIQSKKLVRNSDLILAIATPAAQSVVNEAKEREKTIPILFTAVTDPVDAKLIASNERPGGNVTGTNDLNPIKEQIALVTELVPTAQKLGIIYTASESNSELQVIIAKAEAEALGLEVIVRTIESVADLQLVANNLASNVDVLYIPTDNLIVAAMGTINEVVLNKRIPAVVADPGSISKGGSITYGVDYYQLGKLTAEMAVQILRDGTSPKDIPSIGLSDFALYINKKQLDEIGVAIPQSLLDDAKEIIE